MAPAPMVFSPPSPHPLALSSPLLTPSLRHVNATFDKLPHTVGNYTFKKLLGMHEHHELYIARQDEVEREVFIELYRQDSPEAAATVSSFLNSVKMRAHSNLPRTMQVYETVQIDDICFVAYQLPQGLALSELAEKNKELSVLSICRVIEQYATLYLAADKLDIPTRRLNADMIFIESEESFYFLSPLCAECDMKERSLKDEEEMNSLAKALNPLLPHHVEGSSRTFTLVSWLREGYEGEYLSWESIQATAINLIEQVLPNWQSTEAVTELYKSKAARDRYQAHAKKVTIIYIVALALFLILTTIGALRIKDKLTPPSAPTSSQK